MPGKGNDQAQGLAEQSVNTSIVHPGQGGSDHTSQARGSAGARSLTGNDQRKGLEKTDPDAPRQTCASASLGECRGPQSPHEAILEEGPQRQQKASSTAPVPFCV